MSLPGKFDWAAYLRECGAQAAPASAFRQSSETLRNDFAIGMKLEARDPRNSTAMCIATVVDKVGPRIALRLDGTDDRNDFWRLVDSIDICHIGATPSIIDGRCKQRPGMLLQPPFAFMKRERDWVRMYQAVLKNRERHAPASFFKKQPPPIVRNQFEVGMKLEAVDRKNARLICVASVGEVRNDQVLIHFDGWRGAADYWTRFDSRDLFPPGWCEKVGHRLEPPGPGYTGTCFKVEPLLVLCERRTKVSPLKATSRLQRTKKRLQHVSLSLRSLEDSGRKLRSSKKLQPDGEQQADESCAANSDSASDRGPLRRRKAILNNELPVNDLPSTTTKLNSPGQALRVKRSLHRIDATPEPKLKVRRIETSKLHRAQLIRTKPPICEAKLLDASVEAETKVRVVHQRDILNAPTQVSIPSSSFLDDSSRASSTKPSVNLQSSSKHACTNSTDANANQHRPSNAKHHTNDVSTNQNRTRSTDANVNQNRLTHRLGKKSQRLKQNHSDTNTNRNRSKATNTIPNRNCSTDTGANQTRSTHKNISQGQNQKRSTDTNQNQQRSKNTGAKLGQNQSQNRPMFTIKNRSQSQTQNRLVNKSNDQSLTQIQNSSTANSTDQIKCETQNHSMDTTAEKIKSENVRRSTDQTNSETQNLLTSFNTDQLQNGSTDTNVDQIKSQPPTDSIVKSTEQDQIHNNSKDTNTDEIKSQNQNSPVNADLSQSQSQNRSTELSSYDSQNQTVNAESSVDQSENDSKKETESATEISIQSLDVIPSEAENCNRSADASTDQSQSLTTNCLAATATTQDRSQTENQSSGDSTKELHQVIDSSATWSSSNDANTNTSVSQSHSTDADTNRLNDVDANDKSKSASTCDNRIQGSNLSNCLNTDLKQPPCASTSGHSNSSTERSHSIQASANRNRCKDSNSSHNRSDATLREPGCVASTSTNITTAKIEQPSVQNVAPVGPVRRANTFSFSIDSLLKRPESTPPRTVAQPPIWFPHPSNFIVPSMFVAPPHVFVQQRIYRSQPANCSTPAATSSDTNANSRSHACVECRRLLGIPLCGWSVENVTHYLWHCDVCSSCFVDVDAFVRHEIDGEALGLLDGELLVRHLGMQPGPAAATMRLIDDLKAKLKRFSSSRSKITADA